MSYQLQLRGEVFEMAMTLSAKERQRLAELMRSLTAQPFQVADRERRDVRGQFMKVRRGRGFSAVFQVDHLRKEVLLLEVERLSGR